MNYQIEKYRKEQQAELFQIWEKSVAASHHFLLPVDFEFYQSIVKFFDFDSLNTYCLVENNSTIGFIALQGSKIEMLFLDPKYFGKGLGQVLISFAKEAYKVKFVDVNEQNTNAIKFYKKMGFQVFERMPKDDFGNAYPILKMKIA